MIIRDQAIQAALRMVDHAQRGVSLTSLRMLLSMA
jgi:hypothetical protein